jgi:hypothetical protein
MIRDQESQNPLPAANSFLILRVALTANLLFSLASAFVFLFGAEALGARLGAIPVWLLQAVGVGLFGFVGVIAYALVRLRIGWALLISALDIGWVIGTVPLVLIPGLLTPWGQMATLGVAACVGLWAVGQLFGTYHALKDRAGGPGHYRHCVRVPVSANADAMWRVVADLGAMRRYSAGLSNSEMLSGDDVSVGSVRRCTDHQGQSWQEEVAEWRPEARAVVLRFRTEEPDFPFPFDMMVGGWTISPAGDGALVDIWWKVVPRSRLFGWLILALMTVLLDRAVPKIVGRMESQALNRPLDLLRSDLRLAYC